jgi:hypothetical protein
MPAPPQLGGPKTIELQKPQKSLEEREREYALARQKIFNDNKQAAEREDKERRERDNITRNHHQPQHNSGSSRARPSGGRGVDDPYGGGGRGGGRGAGRSGNRGGRARENNNY